MGAGRVGVSRPFTEALIRLGSGEGACVESRPVSTQGLHPLPFILPLPSSLFLYPSIPGLAAFPHSTDKMAGREEEEEGWKLKGQLRLRAADAHWVKPTTEALISVSPSLMCARQNPFVSHLFPWFGPDSSGWAVEDQWQSDGTRRGKKKTEEEKTRTCLSFPIRCC